VNRRVEFVAPGSGPVAAAFRAAVRARASDLEGIEGLVLASSETLGRDAGVIVDSGEGDVGPADLVDAVRRGHVVVTASVYALAGPIGDWAVLSSDDRLGLSAALAPGLPLVALLANASLGGLEVEEVRLAGSWWERARDDAVVISRLLRVEISRAALGSAQASNGPERWECVVRPGRLPVLYPAAAALLPGHSSAQVLLADAREPVRLAGPVAGPAQVAAALLSDLIRLARAAETPWRAHRRRVLA
jgi:homoserine dehydrogenase